MAAKPSRQGQRAQRTSTRHLSGLQRSILQCLYSGPRRAQTDRTLGLPYTALVEVLAVGKADVVTNLRQLMRKGLVEITLPRGGWTRSAILTAQGEAYARTLAKEERKSSLRDHAGEMVRRLWQEERQRHTARRREPKRVARRKRDLQHRRHRSQRDRW